MPDHSLKILTYTTLYPNAAQPSHGVFVEERMRRIAAIDGVGLRVCAPVPWFPLRARAFGKYAAFAACPRREMRHDIAVSHPRYPAIPKVGMAVAPDLLAAWTRRDAAYEMRSLGGVDLIDAHYLYPDGVAAMRLAAWFGAPFFMTARGADVNLIAQMDGPRRRILKACAAAAGIITVSASLKQRLAALGAPADKIRVINNGVDLETFAPLREAARAAMRARYLASDEQRLLLTVGQLIERKGHHLAIGALKELPDCHLLIAGAGPLRASLERDAHAAGVAARVSILGQVPHHELAALYGAADALILASESEGMANVMLESLACGAPVLATPVDGALEVITSPAAGALLAERSAPAIASAAQALFARPLDREAVRACAQGRPWSRAAELQAAFYRQRLEAVRG